MLPTIDDIRENFSLLDDWEDRYRYLIELGRMMPELPEALHSEANRVRGCTSQVWLASEVQRRDGEPIFVFAGDSDAHIVRGLVALLVALHSGKPAREVAKADTLATFRELGLEGHLTPQRSNGLKSMVDRIRRDANLAAG